AGERTSLPSSPAPLRVHPRACGGEPAESIPHACLEGPSPRVRGREAPLVCAADAVRSIPARAGERTVTWTDSWRGGVHPRACGGEPSTKRRWSNVTGPSPRVRGRVISTGAGY